MFLEAIAELTDAGYTLILSDYYGDIEFSVVGAVAGRVFHGVVKPLLKEN